MVIGGRASISIVFLQAALSMVVCPLDGLLPGTVPTAMNMHDILKVYIIFIVISKF